MSLYIQHNVIESGVPIPPKAGGSGRPLKFEWGAMNVGDSVLMQNMTSVISAHKWGRTHGRKFTSRKRKEPPYGFRIWRIE